jgi:hypothetical protein
MKKMITKTTKLTTAALLLLFVLSNLHVVAQRKAAPEFSVYANGGIALYSFRPLSANVPSYDVSSRFEGGVKSKVHSSLGFSSDFGMGFTGFFSQQVGIHTGVGFGLSNVTTKAYLYNLAPGLYDDLNPHLSDPHFDLHTAFEYTEKHKPKFITIPVMLQFQTKQKQYWSLARNQKPGFYALGGIKINFLLPNTKREGYEVIVDKRENYAYYTDLHNWGEYQPAGLGKQPGYDKAGKLDFGLLVMLALETGVKWRIDNNHFIYTGVFFDCGLNNPTKNNRSDYTEITTTGKLPDLGLLKFSDRLNAMVVGVKVRFAFTKNQRGY